MSYILVDLRKAVHSALKAATSVIPENANIVEAPLPQRWELIQADASITTPLIKVLSMSAEGTKITRRPSVQHDVTIMVILASPLPVDIEGEWVMTEVDKLLELTHDIEKVIRQVKYGSYGWIRNDEIRDESGLPFSYALFRENNIFQSYLNSVFRGIDCD